MLRRNLLTDIANGFMDVRKAVEDKTDAVKAYVVGEELKEITLKLGDLTDNEREIILKGCLINYYRG